MNIIRPITDETDACLKTVTAELLLLLTDDADADGADADRAEATGGTTAVEVAADAGRVIKPDVLAGGVARLTLVEEDVTVTDCVVVASVLDVVADTEKDKELAVVLVCCSALLLLVELVP